MAVTHPPTVQSLPDDVLVSIFNRLSLKSRVRISAVCSRWRTIIQAPSMPSVGICVMNIFEGQVWDAELGAQLKERFTQWHRCCTLDVIAGALAAIGQCEVVKLWYRSDAFLDALLPILRRHLGGGLKGLDVYAYKDHVRVEAIGQLFGEIESFTLRPHGKKFFNCGISLSQLPTDLPKLDTLTVENVTLGPDLRFPPNIGELEYTVPRDTSGCLATFLDKLAPCQNLKYFLMAHAEFGTDKAPPGVAPLEYLERLLAWIASRDSLLLMGFKFCKFGGIKPPFPWDGPKRSMVGEYQKATKMMGEDQKGNRAPLVLRSLKALKIDLCYGDVPQLVDVFMELCPNLRLISYETVLTECGVKDVSKLLGLLYRRSMLLKLSVLQRCSGSPDTSVKELEFPAEYADVLCRLDMSFIEDPAYVSVLFPKLPARGVFTRLAEFRAVRCDGVSDATLVTLATCCPALTRVTLNACAKLTHAGLWSFLEHWNAWRGPNLTLILANSEGVCLPMMCERLVNGGCEELSASLELKLGFEMCRKTVPENSSFDPGAKDYYRLCVWDKESLAKKRLQVQNYAPSLLNTIVGLVVPFECSAGATAGDVETGVNGVCEHLEQLDVGQSIFSHLSD